MFTEPVHVLHEGHLPFRPLRSHPHQLDPVLCGGLDGPRFTLRDEISQAHPPFVVWLTSAHGVGLAHIVLRRKGGCARLSVSHRKSGA